MIGWQYTCYAERLVDQDDIAKTAHWPAGAIEDPLEANVCRRGDFRDALSDAPFDDAREHGERRQVQSPLPPLRTNIRVNAKARALYHPVVPWEVAPGEQLLKDRAKHGRPRRGEEPRASNDLIVACQGENIRWLEPVELIMFTIRRAADIPCQPALEDPSAKPMHLVNGVLFEGCFRFLDRNDAHRPLSCFRIQERRFADSAGADLLAKMLVAIRFETLSVSQTRAGCRIASLTKVLVSATAMIAPKGSKSRESLLIQPVG